MGLSSSFTKKKIRDEDQVFKIEHNGEILDVIVTTKGCKIMVVFDGSKEFFVRKSKEEKPKELVAT